MNKKRLLVIIMILILCIVGCKKSEDNYKFKDGFNIQLSKKAATRYLDCLKRNDIEGANAISTPDLATQNKVKSLADTPIVSFSIGNLTETGSSAYVEYKCARINKNSLNANLDIITVNVVKLGDEYKVSDIKSDNLKEIYVKSNELRSIINGEGSSELVFTLNDLPEETYPKYIIPPIKKEKIPKDKFSALGISYAGSNVAFGTTNGKDSFVGIAIVEQEKESMANVQDSLAQGKDGESKGVDENTLRKVFEKPTAQKIIPYDILKDSKIENLIFTEEEGDLLVQYTQSGKKGMGLKIYKNPDGKLVEIDFEKLFPMDKYNIVYEMATKTELIISVLTNGERNDISQGLLGKYRIDLVKEVMDKI